jgi:hypothetical protein
MPRVLNVRDLPGYADRQPVIPPDAVYIGRPNSRYGLAGSKWRNPFRGEGVVEMYRRWLCSQWSPGVRISCDQARERPACKSPWHRRYFSLDGCVTLPWELRGALGGFLDRCGEIRAPSRTTMFRLPLHKTGSIWTE